MNLTVSPAEFHEVADHLAAAVKHDATGGTQNAADLAADAFLFKVVTEEGAIVAAYSMRIHQHEKHSVAWVVAAGGRLPGVDLLATVVPVIKRQARECGASQVALITRRQGMVKRMKKQGFAVTGVVMRGAV